MPANSAQKSSTSGFSARRLSIAEEDVANGLDRANLNELRLRFLELSQHRATHLRDSLRPGQQLFLDLLPLLFHLNHPSLPGYVSESAPCGVCNFKVGREHVKAARTIAKSFSLQRDPNSSMHISAIYLMGSCGSLAHNNRSDIDAWVCTAAELDDTRHEALQRKCAAISAWAATLKLEVHFFVMHEASFRQHKRAPMGGENCGRTQHYLLLDELYRTAIIAAGNIPLWWLVPQSHDSEYTAYAASLIEKRHINEGEFTDYGSAAEIPAAEFISAGVWQLYKGISSPYKALLKLMLVEAYAADPAAPTLSAELKQKIYSGDYGLDELDPYLQVYRRVERYLLANEQHDRLELARRCLYFKAGIKLSRAPVEAENSESLGRALEDPRYWRRSLMHKLVAEWGWRRPQLRKLDDSPGWSFNEIVAEQHRLTRELVHSYRLLSTLVKRQQEQPGESASLARSFEQDSRELNILGRQLYAIFEQKPHKVSRLAASLANQTEQELIHLTLEHNADGKPIWAAQLAANDTGERETVKRAESAAEVLVWCIINGLVGSTTRFNVDEGDHELSEYEIRQLCTSLANQLPCLGDGAARDAKQRFAKPAHNVLCIFIANCGIDPLKAQRAQGTLRVSAKNDPLAYSGLQENLVASLTLVQVNSWQETFCYHFHGEHALNECLTHYLALGQQANSPDKSQALPQRSILCACATRPGPIASRLESLLDDIEKCYFTESNGCLQPCEKTRSERRYVFQSAYGFHVMNWNKETPQLTLIGSETELLEHLSNPDHASAVTIDSYALQQHPLSTICRKLEAGQRDRSAGNSQSAAANRVRVFYVVKDGFAETYLTDQRHALCYARIPYESTRALILPLRQFIERSSLRRSASGAEAGDEFASFGFDDSALSPLTQASQELPDIEFFALQQNAGHYSATLVPTEANISAKYLPIKAVGSQSTDGHIDWAIHCNDELFDQAILGERLFTEVATSIKKYRRPGQPAYRCYINDIEVHRQCGGSNTLVQDFYYKNRLEDALNNAFALL
ncbi:MAG: class I adenylate cyclase [Pseudomonadales bacterium]